LSSGSQLTCSRSLKSEPESDATHYETRKLGGGGVRISEPRLDFT